MYVLVNNPISNSFSTSFIVNIIEEHKTSLSGDVQLALFIVNEMKKGTSSFYYPYLQIIPASDCLVEWTEDELQLLEVTYMRLCTCILYILYISTTYHHIYTVCNVYNSVYVYMYTLHTALITTV